MTRSPGRPPKALGEKSPRTRMVTTKIQPSCADAIQAAHRAGGVSLAELIEAAAAAAGIWVKPS